ncbi:IS66 family insertion sequence element accessory protein TnpB [Allopusillimonas ginsengisoli]|uniref:IS66 family insertion sequence element accessory protein TnpB n=1 Tax=Allopusillimonas ginsengisoli TaxID=453575 RepID=UPI0039C43C0B
MIRVDQIWLAVEPMDMRADSDMALARVVKDFGAARPHHAYIFANRRANRMKILVHDGLGVWLAARRLSQGRFVWPRPSQIHIELTDGQLQGLVIGLPWHRMGDSGII